MTSLVLSGLVLASALSQPSPRRIVLATLDTTRADRLGCYGHAKARTPFLDRMAKEGARFERAWCPAPITLPSHATILSGVLPCAHGVRDNGLFELDGSATLLSEVLKGHGFATGAFVGSFVLDARFGLAQGFDVYRGPQATQVARQGFEPEVVQRPAASVVDDALQWLDSLPAGASFFLWVHFYDPHAPHEPSYDAEIASCDEQLARLRRRLDERGFDEGLLEIATADHGEGLGEHGEETHGLLLHDATMRVPLLVRGAGVPAGRVVATPVGLAQIAPTVLAWLGIEDPGALMPEARARPLSFEAASATESEPAEEPEPLVLETLLPFDLHRWQPLTGLVWRGHKLVRGRFDELFDLAADPAENRNLSSEQKDLLAAMARRLEATLSEQPRLALPASVSLSDEERAALSALGYAGAASSEIEPASDLGSGSAASSALPDPREVIGDEAIQVRALALFKQARELLGQDVAAGRPLAPVDETRRARGHELLANARALLLPLAEKRPGDPSIAFDLGNVELSAGRPAEAVPRFELAALADPKNATHHYNLAIAHAGAGETAYAIAEMEKAVACEPRFLLAWRWLVATHDQRSEFGRAIWWADRVESSGALEPRDLAPMKAMREQLRARMVAAGQQPDPPKEFPPKDLRPERAKIR